MIPLPEDYIGRMRELLGSEFPLYCEAMSEPPKRSLRVNTLKVSADEVTGRIEGLIPNGIVDEGFLAPPGFFAGRSILHHCGAFYMQEASAQLPASLLGIREGMCVLDLCAAPGGKAGQAAAYLNGSGLIVANEPQRARVRPLVNNLERLGVTNAIVTGMEPAALCERLRDSFDAVLIDAPCSGEGMFRKDERAILDWSKRHVLACAVRQKEILAQAEKALKAGGLLVYSTCTFSREENEGVIEDFLARRRDFSLISSRRLYPHTCTGEGQFVAVLKREGRLRKDEFCEPVVSNLPDGRVFLLPAMPFSLDKLKLIRAGLLLGERRGKVFVPSHASAMAAGAKHENTVELCKSEAMRYLRGETLDVPAKKGWCVLRYEGLALGLGKAGAEGIKNHLPRGLLFSAE
ncbi:MAG: RsmF rRNA methyltransferase first C-terminal domain-containing protein [Clostridia bacterium]|nr:RsmF rRNA methyltransferase first C-terminal domain-containing protein [Clostridia bacterium]